MWIFNRKKRHQRKIEKAYNRYFQEITKISQEFDKLHQEASDILSSSKEKDIK